MFFKICLVVLELQTMGEIYTFLVILRSCIRAPHKGHLICNSPLKERRWYNLIRFYHRLCVGSLKLCNLLKAFPESIFVFKQSLNEKLPNMSHMPPIIQCNNTPQTSQKTPNNIPEKKQCFCVGELCSGFCPRLADLRGQCLDSSGQRLDGVRQVLRLAADERRATGERVLMAGGRGAKAHIGTAIRCPNICQLNHFLSNHMSFTFSYCCSFRIIVSL